MKVTLKTENEIVCYPMDDPPPRNLVVEQYDYAGSMLGADFKEKKKLFEKFDALVMKVKYTSDVKPLKHRMCSDDTIFNLKQDALERIQLLRIDPN